MNGMSDKDNMSDEDNKRPNGSAEAENEQPERPNDPQDERLDDHDNTDHRQDDNPGSADSDSDADSGADGGADGDEDGDEDGGEDGSRDGDDEADRDGDEDGGEDGSRDGDDEADRDGDEDGGEHGDEHGGEDGGEDGDEDSDEDGDEDGDEDSGEHGDEDGGEDGEERAVAADADDLFVVGLGASAGGLGALQDFFEAMPPDTGAAFVVVVHLPPDHDSSFAHLLDQRTEMVVTQASDGVELEPNHVYVIPPNHNITVVDQRIELEPLEDLATKRAPIDHFFRTLASAHDDRAVGVILSGSGSDGSVGLRLIKERGGFTLAQDPGEAEFAAMPQNAMDTGQVDQVLPVQELATQIERYLTNKTEVRMPTKAEQLTNEQQNAFNVILTVLRDRTQYDFSPYRRPTLLRRIQRRAQIQGLRTLPAYQRYLENDPEESNLLYQDLLITVTNFFRDAKAFEALQERVVPELFADKQPGEQVRVWSVGCATGEEAYSLAIVLQEHAATLEAPPRIRIFATDVNEDVLARAREGRYPKEIINDVSPERLKRFFVREENDYRIRREIREQIVFSAHNLLEDPPFSHLDLVVCRNVLIYLKRDVQRDVYELYHYSLRPEGHLFLGSTESLDDDKLFRSVHRRHGLYQRQKVSAAKPRLPNLPIRSLSASSDTVNTRSSDNTRSSESRKAEPDSYGSTHYKMIERYAPPSLLVNEDYDAVHYSENVGRYLQQPGGEPSDNIFERVRPPLQVGLRAALHLAFRKEEASRSRPVPVTIEGEERDVVVWVRPTDDGSSQKFALVMFDDSETFRGVNGGDVDIEAGTEEALEEELEATKARLSEVLEEYERSQEEMRAANEELQSMNEELQSTAEELETSKEELQSANEELITINQENRNRVEELGALADDLQNLLRATDIAILFLDRELKIKRFTPRAHDLFNFVRTDIGRPIDHFTNRIGDSTIVEDAREVLERLVPIEREIKSDDGNDYLMRMLPYRTSEDRIDGVVTSLVDVTELKQTERELQQLTAELEGRVEARTEQVRGLMSALSLAEQRERARIAQVLHDDVQQMLFALQMKLRQLQKNSPDTLTERYDDANDLLKQAFQMVRTLSVGLNPPLLKEEGLEAALRWVSEQMEETYDLNLSLDIDLGDAPPLEQGRQLLLYHASRELLFNVIKHAGVKTARFAAQVRDGSVRIEIADGGVGFDGDAALNHDTEDQHGEGFGLYSIRERLRLFGGSLDLVSKKGNGTLVTLTMPLEASEPHTMPIEASESQSGERAQ